MGSDGSMCLVDEPLEDGRRQFVRAPEYRALEQIVADADREGRQVVVLGPAGILEVTPRNGDPAYFKPHRT